MVAKIYKRTDASRDVHYQDKLLLSVISPDAIEDLPVYFNEQRDELVRKSRRAERDTIYCASLALLADEERDIETFLKAVKSRGHKLVCVEESLTWSGGKPIGIVVAQWKEASLLILGCSAQLCLFCSFT